jgi:hypothetical protein
LFLVAMADEDAAADDADDLRAMQIPSHRVLDVDDEPFPADDDEQERAGLSSSSSSPKHKERGRFRIHNVGGSLTFLLQVPQFISLLLLLCKN